MTEWRSSTWGHEVSLEYGKAIRGYSEYSGRYRVFGSNGPIGWTSEPLANGPGVILGRKGAYRGVRYCQEPFFVIDTAYYVVPKTNVDMRWLYYAIIHHKLGEIDDGSPIPSTTRSAVYVRPITVPPIHEQNAIASILGALDDKIDLNRRMNDTIEAILSVIFKDWFIDFGPTRAKMEGRVAYLLSDIWSRFPNRLDSDGKPEGWQTAVLEDAIDELETGGRPKGGVSAYADGIPSIGAESIVGLGQFDFSKTKFVPQEFFRAMKKGLIKNRDVLLYKDGGRPGLFEPHLTLFGDGFPFERCAINEHVYRLRAKREIGQNYLYFWLSSELVMEEMRIKGTGVAIPGLNSTQVKTLTTLIPTPEIVEAFNLAADPMITRVLANCNEARALSRMRDMLIPKLLAGEIRLMDAEKIVETAA
jgi:type I restriction enzyme S subunit